MGGAKKRSLKQIEKQQSLRSRKQQTEKQKRKKPELRYSDTDELSILNLENTDIKDDLSKMKAITPYTLATKYNIKLSAAKMVLKNLEQKGLIQLVAGNNNLKIYRRGNIA